VTAQVKPLLLRVLGDLEGVWADAALQDILLKLPLAAMKVLLGCDELQVGTALALYDTITADCECSYHEALGGALC